MDFAALFKLVQSWGPSAISSLMVIVMLYLIKKVDKNGEDDKKRAKDFQDSFEHKIQELREETAKILDEHGRELSYIKMEYTKRDDFYRELGGWKEDINRLSSQITEFTKNIIELWKDKK